MEADPIVTHARTSGSAPVETLPVIASTQNDAVVSVITHLAAGQAPTAALQQMIDLFVTDGVTVTTVDCSGPQLLSIEGLKAVRSTWPGQSSWPAAVQGFVSTDPNGHVGAVNGAYLQTRLSVSRGTFFAAPPPSPSPTVRACPRTLRVPT
jgi:hypothetical protein